MPKSSTVGIHLHEQHLPERVMTMELEQLLQLLANFDKPHLEQLIYALIDIHGLNNSYSRSPFLCLCANT